MKKKFLNYLNIFWGINNIDKNICNAYTLIFYLEKNIPRFLYPITLKTVGVKLTNNL